jgi:hypothetical protein
MQKSGHLLKCQERRHLPNPNRRISRILSRTQPKRFPGGYLSTAEFDLKLYRSVKTHNTRSHLLDDTYKVYSQKTDWRGWKPNPIQYSVHIMTNGGSGWPTDGCRIRFPHEPFFYGNKRTLKVVSIGRRKKKISRV